MSFNAEGKDLLDDWRKKEFEPAPEPADVIWENINIPTIRKIGYSFIVILATLALIAACFYSVLGFKKWRDRV